MSTIPNEPSSGGYGGAPSYGSPPAGGGGTNVVGIIALVLAILGAVLAFCTFGVAGILGGIAAIVLGVIGRNKAKRGEVGGAGLALGGLILGVVALVLGVGVLVASLFFLNKADDIRTCSTLGTTQEQQQCLQDSMNG